MTKCDINKVNSEICVVPGSLSSKPIRKGKLYLVRNSFRPDDIPFAVTSRPVGEHAFLNRTTWLHPFKGGILRTFHQVENGSIWVDTRGTGKSAFGLLDALNEAMGPGIFQRQDWACAQYLAR